MGVTLVVGMAVLETALAAFSIATRSDQRRARRILHIAALPVFLLLVALGAVDFGPSYYALAALLLGLAAVAGIAPARRKESEDKRGYKPARVVLGALGVAVLLFVAALPAILFPGYHRIEASGGYQVAAAAYTYTDTNRIETFTARGEHRRLNVGLWFPETAEEKHPLIVFSHGGISNRASNESLYHELAAHGYVVAAIDHTYHSLSTTDESGKTISIDLGYMRELNAEDAKSNRQQSYEYYQKWMGVRTGDISFVIDHLLSQAESGAGGVYSLIDTAAKVGVIGHSLGGSAALALGRMRDDVGAVVALESPFMADIVGVENGEFVFTDEAYLTPVLNVYSDSAWGHLAEWPQYAQNDRLLSDAPATAFSVHLGGVGHFSLTDLALSSPLLTRLFNGFPSTISAEECLETINRLCLDFFNSFLKGEGQFTAGGAT